MKSLLIGFQAVVVLIAVVLSPQLSFAQRQAVPGEFLIKFKTGAGGRLISGRLPHKFQVRKNMGGVKLVKNRLVGDNSINSSRQLESPCKAVRSQVRFCEPNYKIHAFGISPDDSKFRNLWGMNKIGAKTAWTKTVGSNNIVVAIIDTGIDYNHLDLAQNIWVNPFEIPDNDVDDDGNGYVDDIYGYDFVNRDGQPLDDNEHGTHLAGTIGAVGNNQIGVAGVNWNVKLMALKFLDEDGSGTIADAIEAINYVRQMKINGVNVRVANTSWGGAGYSAALKNAIARAGSAGILFAAAAGNEAENNDRVGSYPAGFRLANIVSVAASDRDDSLAYFSNYGRSVDIAAPGVSIVSTTPGNQYDSFSGTSMAAPHVAGAAALALSLKPNLSVSQLKSAILNNAYTDKRLENQISHNRRLDLKGIVKKLTAKAKKPKKKKSKTKR